MIQRMPQLKMADSAILQEKSIISPRNVADNEEPPSRNLEKNLSRDIKHLFEDFSRTRPALLSFLFSTNYFSTPPPPRACPTKKSLHISCLQPQLSTLLGCKPTWEGAPTPYRQHAESSSRDR